MKYRVELTENVVEFILSLPVKMQAKIQRTTELLSEFGYALPEPHSKKLKSINDLFELRVQAGNTGCRSFYFYWRDRIYVIISGCIKKSNKTDKGQIRKAINIMRKFKEKGNE